MTPKPRLIEFILEYCPPRDVFYFFNIYLLFTSLLGKQVALGDTLVHTSFSQQRKQRQLSQEPTLRLPWQNHLCVYTVPPLVVKNIQVNWKSSLKVLLLGWQNSQLWLTSKHNSITVPNVAWTIQIFLKLVRHSGHFPKAVFCQTCSFLGWFLSVPCSIT